MQFCADSSDSRLWDVSVFASDVHRKIRNPSYQSGTLKLTVEVALEPKAVDDCADAWPGARAWISVKILLCISAGWQGLWLKKLRPFLRKSHADQLFHIVRRFTFQTFHRYRLRVGKPDRCDGAPYTRNR